MKQEGVWPNCFTFVRVLNVCPSAVAVEKGRYTMSRPLKMGASQMSLLGIAWLTCM